MLSFYVFSVTYLISRYIQMTDQVGNVLSDIMLIAVRIALLIYIDRLH